MNFIRNSIGFLIGTNIYIAIVATGFIFSRQFAFDQIDFLELGLVFFATQLSYNTQRYLKWKKQTMYSFLNPFLPSNTLQWLILLFINFIAFCCCLFLLNSDQFFWTIISGSISAFYLFIHPFKKKLTGIRYIPFLKTIIVALAWTILMISVSYSTNHLFLIQKEWLFHSVVFMQIWISCIIFDLRDIDTDKKNVRTFANAFSQWKFFFFWLSLTAILFLLTFLTNQQTISHTVILYTGVAFIHLYCLFMKPNGLWFTFIADGSLLLCATSNYFLLKFQ